MAKSQKKSSRETRKPKAEKPPKANASNPSTKWLILLCHRPLYSSDVSEESTHVPGSPFLRSLEPLMQKFRVDLVLTGHMHMSAYERSTRARRQREWSRWQRGKTGSSGAVWFWLGG